MSSKAKKQKSNKAKSSAKPKNSEVIEFSAKYNERLGFLGRAVFTLAGPTVLATFSIYTYFAGSGKNVSGESNWGDALILAMAIFAFIVLIFTLSLDLAVKFAKVQETANQGKLRQATILKTYTVAITTILYGFALKQGYLEGFSIFLKSNIFPALGEGINYIISNIVGWILSGVIGNFFYDKMKQFSESKKGEK